MRRNMRKGLNSDRRSIVAAATTNRFYWFSRAYDALVRTPTALDATTADEDGASSTAAGVPVALSRLQAEALVRMYIQRGDAEKAELEKLRQPPRGRIGAIVARVEKEELEFRSAKGMEVPDFMTLEGAAGLLEWNADAPMLAAPLPEDAVQSERLRRRAALHARQPPHLTHVSAELLRANKRGVLLPAPEVTALLEQWRVLRIDRIASGEEDAEDAWEDDASDSEEGGAGGVTLAKKRAAVRKVKRASAKRSTGKTAATKSVKAANAAYRRHNAVARSRDLM
jgi:hypothetical protein